MPVILVIDDEPHIRRMLGEALSAVPARVLEARTGSEALEIAAASNPDLVVLDLGLPDRPGMDVYREFRRWSTAPIVVLSARHAESEKIDLLNAGADDYVRSPSASANSSRARMRSSGGRERPGRTRNRSSSSRG